MEKKWQGSVSLFSAMIFLLVVSVIAVTILSARIQASSVMVTTGLNLAMDSMLASYDQALFEEYGVLLFDGAGNKSAIDQGVMSDKIADYLSYTIDPDKNLLAFGTRDLYGITLLGIQLEQINTAIDQGGLLWMNSAVEYEKYAKPIQLAADFLKIKDTKEEAEEVAAISEQIVECSDQIVKIHKDAKSLLAYVDGVKCPETGLDFQNIITTEPFLKQLCPREITPNSLQIPDQIIFDALQKSIHNPMENLIQLKEYWEGGNNHSFGKKEKELQEEIRKVQNPTNQALEILYSLNEQIDEVKQSIVSIEDKTNASDLSSDSLEGVTQELDQMKDYKEILAENLCDLDGMKTTLLSNQRIYGLLLHQLEIWEFPDQRAFDNWYQNLIESYKSISFKDTSFRYQQLGQSKEDQTPLDQAKGLANQGVLNLVKPTNVPISNRTLTYENLASDVYDSKAAASIMNQCGGLIRVEKNIVYGEYVLDHFYTFTDKKKGDSLNYEAEYILYGKASDQDNLASAVYTIATIRSGMNMLYLMTDSEKKNQAYALAATMVGATGIEPLIRILQYTILYLWAYAEGLMDVKILLEGKELSLVKTSKEWQLSLENLLSGKLTTNRTPSQKGLNYEHYLRLLLYMEEEGKKSARTMDLVEAQKIQSGKENFRLKNYVFGMKATALYQIKGYAQDLEADAAGSY